MSPASATIESVPLLDLRRQNEACAGELRAAFERVLASGQFIMGPEVEAFEAECARLLGARHALGVSSGTDALLLAFMALGVGPGDEVVCPTYTFFATAGCVARLGAKPVFVDVSPVTYNMEAAAVARVLGPRTKAIVPVHLFGQVCDMDPILALAKARNVPVVEDAAQTLSARYKGRAAGTLGAFGCYSFFPSKNLGAFGDAGLLVTDDDALAERARVLRVHGAKPKYYHQLVGANFRIDALQAALLRVKLPRLAGYTEARRRNVARYRERLASLPIGFPEVVVPDPIWNQLVLRVPGDGRRDALIQHLKERRIGVEVYYPVPLHRQECFRELGYRDGAFPVSERAARETLAVPVFPELTHAEIDHVAAAIAAFFAEKP